MSRTRVCGFAGRRLASWLPVLKSLARRQTMERLAGFDPRDLCAGGAAFFQAELQPLNYKHGAGSRTRTDACELGRLGPYQLGYTRSKALAPIQGIEPRSVGPEPTVLPLNEIGVVGMVPFERTTSRSQGESSTSELHPDN